jgi:hypothetical protein
MRDQQDPTVATAGRVIAEALGSGMWTHIRHDINELFADVPALDELLHADARLITAATDRDRAVHDVAEMWGLRITRAIGRHPDLTPAVTRLANTGATYNQHNTPGQGGTVFASQGGVQNVYRAP